MRNIVICSIIAVASVSQPAMAGDFTFFEGINGSQNNKGNVSDAAGQTFNLKKPHAPVQNDEVKSVVLHDVRVGTILTVYDSPDGKKSDDWAEIKVKKAVQQYTVNTFEKTYSDDTVDVTYTPNNGLNGKVSRIEVR